MEVPTRRLGGSLRFFRVLYNTRVYFCVFFVFFIQNMFFFLFERRLWPPICLY